jgi:D-alanyl-D-alanine carboxypeptidase
MDLMSQCNRYRPFVRSLLWCLVLLAVPVAVWAGDRQQTRAALAGYTAHPALHGAQVSCLVYEVSAGEPEELFALSPDRPQIPASQMKLVVSAYALDRWGPDFAFDTEVWSAEEPGDDGRLGGDLYVVGSADPETGGSLYVDLARQLRERGVKRIEGEILGVRPGRAEERDLGLKGAKRLHTALGREGIIATGEPGTASEAQRGVLLASHQGRSLSEWLRAMNKPSDNRKAELLLQSVLTYFAPGHQADFLLERWKEKGLAVAGCYLADGSGYSRQSRLTARFVTDLLLWALEEPERGEVLYASLPVAGEDGTLAGRIKQLPPGVRVIAKTGTLPGVSCLSGYVEVAGEPQVVFSILMNELGCSRSRARRIQDQMAIILGRWAVEQDAPPQAGVGVS